MSLMKSLVGIQEKSGRMIGKITPNMSAAGLAVALMFASMERSLSLYKAHDTVTAERDALVDISQAAKTDHPELDKTRQLIEKELTHLKKQVTETENDAQHSTRCTETALLITALFTIREKRRRAKFVGSLDAGAGHGFN